MNFDTRFDLGPARLLSVRSQLETHYKDMQDIEFTIQQGKLYMLQTRNGKRTAPAALQIAVDMAKEGLITKAQALMSLKPDLIDQLLHPTLDPKAKKDVIAKGLPASPGAAGGKVSWLEILAIYTIICSCNIISHDKDVDALNIYSWLGKGIWLPTFGGI